MSNISWHSIQYWNCFHSKAEPPSSRNQEKISFFHRKVLQLIPNCWSWFRHCSHSCRHHSKQGLHVERLQAWWSIRHGCGCSWTWQKYCMIFPGRVVFDLVSLDIHEVSPSVSVPPSVSVSPYVSVLPSVSVSPGLIGTKTRGKSVKKPMLEWPCSPN